MKQYRRQMIKYAKKLRLHETAAEKKLWNEILSHKKLGFKFRRQHPINEHIVDFFCDRVGLVIELDSDYHKGTQTTDLNRQKELENLGFVVLRYSNDEVLFHLDRVRNDIVSTVFAIYENKSA